MEDTSLTPKFKDIVIEALKFSSEGDAVIGLATMNLIGSAESGFIVLTLSTIDSAAPYLDWSMHLTSSIPVWISPHLELSSTDRVVALISYKKGYESFNLLNLAYSGNEVTTAVLKEKA